MAGKGIELFDGCASPTVNAGSATFDEGSTSAGGPIDTPDGLDAGRSATIPEKTANVADGMGPGKGSVISTEVD